MRETRERWDEGGAADSRADPRAITPNAIDVIAPAKTRKRMSCWCSSAVPVDNRGVGYWTKVQWAGSMTSTRFFYASK